MQSYQLWLSWCKSMDERDANIKALKLDLLDRTDGIKVSYLWNYNKELEDIVDLPSQERRKKLEDLARKIKEECKKQVGI